MSTIHLMPLEVLHCIFNSIDSIKQLCNVRRVCKRWDPVAEAIMFSKEICLWKDDKVVQFHNQLLEKPHLAKHIKYLEGRIEKDDNSALAISLFKLTFTPNTEVLSIQGSSRVMTDAYAHLLDMVRKAPNEDYRLKKLPDCIISNVTLYSDLAFAFRNTLQHLEVAYTGTALFGEFDRLSVFKNLVFLDLNMDPARLDDRTDWDIVKLDSILKNCHALEKLAIDWFSYEPYDPSITGGWSKENVQQALSLREVTIACLLPLLIEYLVYKYPNINSWNTHIWKYHSKEQFEDSIRALPLDMPDLKLRLAFEECSSVGTVVGQICDKYPNEKILVQYSYRRVLCIEAVAELYVYKDQEGLMFDVYTMEESVSHREQVQIIDDIGAKVRCWDFTALDLQLLSWRETASLERVIFDDLLSPHLRNVKQISICTDTIEECKLEDYEANSGWTRQLTHLTFQNAKIDEWVFPQISGAYPNLKMLILASCLTYNTEGQQDDSDNRMYTINLPNSTIGELQLTAATTSESARGDFKEHCSYMEQMSKVCGICYLEISILDINVVLYCKLGRFSAPEQMTAEEFASRQDKATATSIKIACNRLAYVSVELGDIHHDLSVAMLLWKGYQEAIFCDGITDEDDVDKRRRVVSSDFQSKGYQLCSRYMQFLKDDLS